MRKYQTSIHGEVDLDDPATYEHLPQKVQEVLHRLWERIGYTRLYFLSPDRRDVDFRGQPERIDQFINALAEDFNSGMYSRPLMFWQERLYMFEDEIENLC